MQYSFTRHLSQVNLLYKLALPSLALVSLLGVNPSVATTHSSNPTVSSEANPVLVANLFRRFRDTVRDINETVNTVDSIRRRVDGGGNQSPQPQASPPPAAPSARPAPEPSPASPPATAQEASPPPATPSARPAPAGSPASPPATAQTSNDVQIIHSDDRPTLCHTHTQRTCESFRMVTMPSEGVLIFSYYFNGRPFSFITSIASEFRMAPGISYRVVGLMYDGQTAEAEGSCGVTRIGGQYRAAVCSTNRGTEFTYTNTTD